jgi:hypothetical protein
MRTCNHNCPSVGFRDARDKAATLNRIAPIVFAFLIGTAANADNPIQDAEIAEAENCHNTGLCAHGAGPPAPAVDPCYIAQNAMRPCTPAQRQPPKPVGVDPHTVGTWELSANNARWVWEIYRNGTYKFHTEGADVAVSHAGTFSASHGYWSLKATTGYTDGGTYLIQPPDTLIATGQLGTAAWRLHALKPASSKLAQ